MSRLIDRLGPVNDSGPAIRRAWQKLVEQVEAQLININFALADMPDIAPITVTADYTGVTESGQLPRVVRAYRNQLTTDVSADATWSLRVASGDITATVDRGAITITAVGAAGVLVVTSEYGGVSKSRNLSITRTVGATPTTGSGGGTSGTDTSFSSINTASMTAISDEITVTIGSSGIATLSAPLTVTTTAGGAPLTATYETYGIWKWWDGASYVDVGTEVASNPDTIVEYDSGFHTVTDGSMSVSGSKTGLAAASSQKFQLYARNASGSRTMYFSGTASVIGS